MTKDHRKTMSELKDQLDGIDKAIETCPISMPGLHYQRGVIRGQIENLKDNTPDQKE